MARLILTRDDPSKPLFGLVPLLATAIIGAAGVAGMAIGIAPGLGRLAAPLVCPAENASSVVVLDVHHSGGKSSTTPHLVCTHASGRMVRVGPGTLFFVQWAAFAAIVVALVLVRRFARRAT